MLFIVFDPLSLGIMYLTPDIYAAAAVPIDPFLLASQTGFECALMTKERGMRL